MATMNVTADTLVVTADSTVYTADGGVRTALAFDPSLVLDVGRPLYLIPINAPPCTFSVNLPGGTYFFRFLFTDANEGGWTLDISDAHGKAVIHGIPLVTRTDLLDGYEYLGLGCRLVIGTTGDPGAAPSRSDLGTSSFLFFQPN